MNESSTEAGAEEVIRKVYAANVRPGEEIRTVFRLLKKAVQTSRVGKRFVVLELVDKTGILQGRIFENIDAADSAIANGDYLLVSGTVSKFRGLPQLVVSSVDRLDPEPIDPAEFAYTPPSAPPTNAGISAPAHNGATAHLPPNLAHWLKHREVAKALDALVIAIEHVARQPRVEKKRPSVPPTARPYSPPPAAPAFKPFQELVQTSAEQPAAQNPHAEHPASEQPASEPPASEQHSAPTPEASGDNPGGSRVSVAPETIVEAGIVQQDALERAKARSKITGLTVEESVLELGLCPEVDLLRHYASKSNTRFVTTERLLSAKVSPEVLEKIPVRIAEEHTIVPVAYEPVSKTLSIVIGDATRAEVIGRIKQVAKVSEIVPLIGVTTAIRAALKKHYYGDATGLDLFRAQGLGGLFAEARALAASAGGRPSSFAAPPNEGSTVTAATRRANAAEVVASLERIALEALSRLSANKSRARWKLRRAEELGRRFDFPDAALEDLRLASLLKSLCAPPKLELLRLPSDEAGRVRARADIAAMMDAASGFALTDNAALTLAHCYEAWDGSGLPSGARGETIPLAARILAVLDAYSLLVHEKESGRQRPRSRAEAFVTLRSSENKLFDPAIVDALSVILDGEALRRHVKAQGRVALLVLREKAARNIYREALEKAEIPVHVSRSLEDAWQNVSIRSASLIVAGLSFGVDPLCRFVSYLRSRPGTCSMPVLALGLAADNAVRDRLIKAGVNLVLDEERPAADDAATIAGIFREQGELGAAGRPVDGETDELSLQEVARIIESNRRSGKLSVRTEAMNGRVDYEQGVPVYASWGEKRGASAKNLLLTLEQAEYVYEPDALLEELPNLSTSST